MTSLKKKVLAVKMIICDVDGVLTDGTVYKGGDGLEFKRFSITDGTGFAMARTAGFKIAFISGRYSASTNVRAAELGISDVYNGTLNKLIPYQSLKQKYDLKDAEIAYLGDDLIDIPVMELVGVSIAVANAHELVKKIAIYVTKIPGGKGAFREALEWILKEQGRYYDVLEALRKEVTQSQ